MVPLRGGALSYERGTNMIKLCSDFRCYKPFRPILRRACGAVSLFLGLQRIVSWWATRTSLSVGKVGFVYPRDVGEILVSPRCGDTRIMGQSHASAAGVT